MTLMNTSWKPIDLDSSSVFLEDEKATDAQCIISTKLREFSTTDNARQSATTATGNHGDPPFTFDPKSSLTLTEQKEKARRIAARQKAEVELQQARQTSISQQAQARRQTDGGPRNERRPNHGGQGFSRRQPGSSARSGQADSTSNGSSERGTSLGSAMLGAAPRSSPGTTPRIRTRGDGQNRGGLNIRKVEREAPPANRGGFVIDGSSRPADQRVSEERRKPSFTGPRQPQKVALPGFLKHDSANEAAPKAVVGWGASEPVLAPVKHRDVEAPAFRTIAKDISPDASTSQVADDAHLEKPSPETNLPEPESPAAVNMGSFGFGYEDETNEPVSAPHTQNTPGTPTDAERASHPTIDSTNSKKQPAEELSEMEAWRRRIEEFDRMNAGSDVSSKGPPKQANRSSDVRFASQAERGSSQVNSPRDRNTITENRYRAMPLDPRTLELSTAAPSADHTDNSGKWQHLRRKTAEQSREASQPASTQTQPSQVPDAGADELWVDRAFQAHQRARRQSAPPQPAVNHSSRHHQIYRDEDKANKVCARCGEKGHIARNCTTLQIHRVNHHFDQPEAHSRGRQGDGAGGPASRLDRRSEGQRRNSEASSGSFGIPAARHEAPGGRSAQQSNVVARNSSEVGADQPPQRNLFRRTDGDETSNYTPSGSKDRISQSVEPEVSESEPRRARFSEPEVPAVVEDTKRGSKDARRRQWEDPEQDIDETAKSNDRKAAKRVNRRERDDDEEDDGLGNRDEHRARKAARKKQKEQEKEQEKQAAKKKKEAKKLKEGTPIVLPEYISIQNLSQMLGVRYEQFVQRLEHLGYDDIFPGKTLNAETSGMIAMEYNFDPTFDGTYREEEERDLKAKPEIADKTSLPSRPPVVTIMGHVDHGKTTILDYLRKSSVAAGEAGGITQHIGAFSVPLSSSGKTITFLDTPGHAAFLAMRQRGANVTDIVILVVAADDSVKPQTLEAIKHARDARVPMIVALNKVDKPEADIERCKQDLARHGVDIEDYGGETQVVCVSGKTGRGMDELEENVVTLSEILDHRAETDVDVEGWVLEATTKLSGRVATVLVRQGTLRPGNIIVAGKTWARVRSLRNEAGVAVQEVGPGMPVEVDGWRDQPVAGDEVLQAPSEQKANSVVDFRVEKADREKTAQDMEAINEARRLEQEKREKEKAAETAAKRVAAGTTPDEPAPATSASTTSDTAPQQQGQLETPFIIKADVSGSAEAVAAYIMSVSSPLIAPTILSSGVGAVHESDIELAYAAEGHIIAFNLPADQDIIGAAKAKGVKILENNIIYRVLDDVKAVLEEKLPPIVTQRVLGEADISAAFDITVAGRKKVKIAGCKIRNGVVSKGSRVRIMRAGEKVYDGVIDSLKSVKKDVSEMRKGTECGIGFDGWETFEVGDSIQCYEEISEKRRL
ncbi:unnamed protein product [Zymoseptoria tritici ST99CH_1A5]|uniref:Translation initiation factor IF-2, mitochondrial n=1 Tax=Zymoseptoria tritici ST99CH_1A5 TaxID=1276529 RepID=A0A1Y6M1Y9_ZYMTR|nr:unnamed protein product [Zymoseptoria tritici ST99CH_1A5]